MRVRKKPALHLEIPSYRSDYVEMPPEFRKVIEEAILNSSTPKLEDDTNAPSTSNSGNPDDIREGTRTPEVRIADPEDGKVENKEIEGKDAKDDTPTDSPVVYRDKNKEGADSVPNNSIDVESCTKKASLNVSIGT